MKLIRENTGKFVACLIVALFLCAGCGDEAGGHEESEISPEVQGDDTEAVIGPWMMHLLDENGAAVAISRDFEPETALLAAAEEDTSLNLLTLTGASEQGERQGIRLVLDVALSEVLGEEDFQVTRFGSGETGFLIIEASSEQGLAYGLYQLARWMGVAYIHPEETVWDQREVLSLDWDDETYVSTPRFSMRGFHEHTQHPTVWSDTLLRPDEPGFRDMVSRYLRWLARNCQNQFTFHMLKTVDVDAWAPYMESIVEEAHGLMIQTGAVIGFVDQQQNAYKMIGELPELSEDEQLAKRVDAVLGTGLDILGIQIGASEFVKPPDEDVRRWIGLLMEHLKTNWPDVKAYAWIHTPCDLEDEDGGLFFHLPLDADPDFGAWVHTTMLYDMENPAPVYGCENFQHQRKFIEEARGERELVYFPETAWWLGFDNNLPMFLPLTGWSRAHDIVTVLSDVPEVTGHLTFTTGREWSYWMFDHYLTRATWDGTTSWSDYLQSVAFVFGENGDEWMQLVEAWTAVQKRFFYDESPLLFFYLAGELPADEAGAKVDAGARPVRPSFQEIYDLSEEEFTKWKANDFDLLQALEQEYATLISKMPEPVSGDEQQTFRVSELTSAMELSLSRAQQSLALFTAVVDMREGNSQAAEANLQAARNLSAAAIERVAIQESGYRYPLELLAREKESLTSYPYGYLHETSTGYFWTRRDDQLAVFLDNVLAVQNEEWGFEPAFVVQAGPEQIVLTEPSDVVASSVIGAFMPTFLFAFSEAEDGAIGLSMAEDTNGNGLPDEGTEQSFEGALAEGTWTGTRELLVVRLIDSAGVLLADLELNDATLAMELETEPDWGASAGSLSATVAPQLLVDTIASFDGIDAAGAEGLIGSIYGFEPGEELPESLPFSFAIEPVQE